MLVLLQVLVCDRLLLPVLACTWLKVVTVVLVQQILVDGHVLLLMGIGLHMLIPVLVLLLVCGAL
jgi:hypothetical protein